MDKVERGIVKEMLLELNSSDNATRNASEKKLKELRSGSPDKYFLYMFEGIRDSDLPDNARMMACIVLRRDF